MVVALVDINLNRAEDESRLVADGLGVLKVDQHLSPAGPAEATVESNIHSSKSAGSSNVDVDPDTTGTDCS